MYLKDDRIIATLNGQDAGSDIVLRSSRLGLAKEYILDPTAVTGWTDGTSARRDQSFRQNSHGDFAEKATLSARAISFSGTALADSIVSLQEMRDALVGAFADGEYGTLTVETAAGVRYASVGLESTTSWVPQTDTVAVWKINLFAPDPFIYGEIKTMLLGTSVVNRGGLAFPLSYPLDYQVIGENAARTVRNLGNAKSWPIFKVTGEYHAGFTVYNNLGLGVTYTGVVTTEAPVEIDMGKGTATQNGVDKTTLVSRRQWFAIEPRETIRPEFIPTTGTGITGSGWCDIIYRDTWI